MAIKTYSPLRYPGGKKKLAKYVEELINIKHLSNSKYVEPFCGGASVALTLLIDGYVNDVIINDYDKSIYAFWFSVLNYCDELCELITNCDICIEEWKRQKMIQSNKENEEILTLGFSTLFLNRTNRSGIIKAGVIGGKEQKGNYKLDCRFNKEKIIKKIKLINAFREHIELYNYDAEELIETIINRQKKKVFIFFDPPYYEQGSKLYTNFYKNKDHISLANKIKEIKYHSWIVTYDETAAVKEIYKNYKYETYKLNYSAERKYKGNEIIFYSKTFDKNIINKEFTIGKYCETN